MFTGKLMASDLDILPVKGLVQVMNVTTQAVVATQTEVQVMGGVVQLLESPKIMNLCQTTNGRVLMTQLVSKLRAVKVDMGHICALLPWDQVLEENAEALEEVHCIFKLTCSMWME